MILLAGDCTGSAYLYTPRDTSTTRNVRKADDINQPQKHLPEYDLAFEIKCGATVGSAAVSPVRDGSGDLHVYIPAYEVDKVHVFRLSKARFR